MKYRRKHTVLLWMLLMCYSGLAEANDCIGVVFTTVVLGTPVALVAWGFIYLKRQFYECCQPQWISFNKTGLEVDLEKRLFGQHIASQIIVKAVDDFMKKENPQKPLVLSLHGPTGTGKNFVSKMIAENIYKEGMHSSYVHVIISEHHFPHKSEIKTYKARLKEWIKNGVSECERSMFIFDEMDKMLPGLIDSIKPFLDFYDTVDGLSYRKAIFIFLSNAGAQSIAETALEFWKAGRDREEIKLSDLENPVSVSAFNNKQSGLMHASVIDKNLVDVFVPFLPLEFSHVVQCVLSEMFARGLGPNLPLAKKVAEEMTYSNKTEGLFSDKGCKTVVAKLSFHL